MLLFDLLFPEMAFKETRCINMPRLSEGNVLPPGEYGLLESYCVEPDCDCRRVVISVLSRVMRKQIATINHAFEPPGPNDLTPEQTFLDPLNIQSKWSPVLLELFTEVALTPDYAARLVRHYQMVKDALKDPAHSIHQRIAAADDSTRFKTPMRSVSPLQNPPPMRRRKGKRR